MFKEPEKKKTFTAHQALIKAQKYCAYQERCQQEVREKLYEWGIKNHEAENIISNLINDNFLNEERFAKAYARGKFRIKKWGRVKIKAALKMFNISAYCIREAIKEISDDEYLTTLQELIKKTEKRKIHLISLTQKHTLAKKIIAKGYEQDLVWETLNNNK
jgi:regulatory protein